MADVVRAAAFCIAGIEMKFYFREPRVSFHTAWTHSRHKQEIKREHSTLHVSRQLQAYRGVGIIRAKP